MPTITRRRDGRYQAILSVDGRRTYIYGRTPAEVREKLQALERQVLLQGGLPVPLTLGELLERWYATERPRWKPKTAVVGRRLLDRFLLPMLGRVRLSRLSPDRLQRVFAAIPGDRQRRYGFQVLHRAFVVAQRWGWLPENPCDRLTPPAYRPERPTLWTPEETRRFLEQGRWSWLWPYVASGA